MTTEESSLIRQFCVQSDLPDEAVFPGNKIEVLENGDEIFPSMLKAIAGAKESIRFLTYVYWKGRIAEAFAGAFIERAKNGVKCRVLLDAHGSFKMSRDLLAAMEDAGVVLAHYNPFTIRSPMRYQHRTHRKILVCDEEVGFIGGVGIADEWDGDAKNPNEWHDFHFRVKGSAVEALGTAFEDNWDSEWTRLWKGGGVASGKGAERQAGKRADNVGVESATVVPLLSSPIRRTSEALDAFRFLLDCCQSSLRITTGYLVPDDEMTSLLCQLARRGVDVEIILPGEHCDSWLAQARSRTRWASLMGAGIRLFRYQPTMCHAKVVIVDDRIATVGSINFDLLSLRLNEEANVVVFDRSFAKLMAEKFEGDKKSSRRVTRDSFEARGVVPRLQERWSKLFPLPYWSSNGNY